MALNPKFDPAKMNVLHPVAKMVAASDDVGTPGKAKPAERVQKIVRINKTLCENFEFYCGHILNSNFNAEVARFIGDEVAKNRAEIERLKAALKK
jgi:hypothetical protein